KSEIFFNTLLVPLDFIMILVGFWAAYTLRQHGVVFSFDVPEALPNVINYGLGGDILPFSQYLRYVLYIAPVMIIVFALTGLYAMRGAIPWGKRLVRIFMGVSVGMFLILLL